jgi:hypothetical protein
MSGVDRKQGGTANTVIRHQILKGSSMKSLVVLILLSSVPAFAVEKLNLTVTADNVVGYWDGAARETQDPDCVYRSNHYACYEDGQLMINVQLGLVNGTLKQGKVWIQSDTGDNADEHNHALLGEPYVCITK